MPDSIPDIVSTPEDTNADNRREDFRPGDVLDGRYRVESVLGSGGMGVVYRVTQMFVDKEFALKTLIKDQISEVKLRRFQQEARAVFALDHPNIVAVKDFGIIEDMTPFLVMELIEGETLSARLKRSGRLTLEEAIPIFVQTCFGLGYAHDQGIVHRDIKPSNIMVIDGIESGAEGSIKILDFGIAKFSQHDCGEIQSLTKTGEVFGSPFYMSPEQCVGERVDHRADVYSLGCVLFEALTGTPPCVGESALSTMMQHQIGKVPTLKEASMGLEFPPELEKIVAKMLDKSPDKRYQKLGLVAHHLAALRKGGSETATFVVDSPEGAKQKKDDRTRKPVVRAADVEPAAAKSESESGPVKAAPKVVSFTMPKFVGLVILILLGSSLIAGLVGYSIGRQQSLQESKSSDSASAGNHLESKPLRLATADLSRKADRAKSENNNSTPHFSHSKLPVIAPVAPAPILSKPRVNTVFSFPKDISIGILKVDDQPPKPIVGQRVVGKHSKLTFFTRHASKHLPKLLDTFRDDDLNGLEVVFSHPEDILSRVKNWKRLEDLSFFDPLIKAMPRCESHEETPVTDELLPQIDNLKTLTTLGLCGPSITGGAVAHMSLLRSLHTLKIKDIKDPESLLMELPRHPNIEEVWLINQDTNNHHLELLAEMPNLKTLTIRRSELTADSLPIFLKMKKLKSLTIDRNNWSEQDKAKFKTAIPGCKFEPVVDVQYWFILPDAPIQNLTPVQTKTGAEIAKTIAEQKKAQAQLNAAQLAALKNSKNSLDLDDSKNEFQLVDKVFRNRNSSIDILSVVVRPDVLEELGATHKEISMILKFPFNLVSPHEKTFIDRLKPYLEKPTIWSHP
ncbi:MAG: serine/threonine protein kinase [Candidatus Melainabacteria bacterium]|nr:MAG: serine/threonine protein kinase [Candidatus Melainabacteria bacterium]